MTKYKVVLADDHELFREGIKTFLTKIDNVELAGEAKNGAGIISLYQKIRPDVVLMDISLPDINGIEATRQILNVDENAKIIILSMYDDEEYIGGCLDAGVKGYVVKSESAMELRSAIEMVLGGSSYFSHMAQEVVIRRFKKMRSENGRDDSEPHITKRELEILKLIAKGHTSNEIAEQLFISIRTVETHRSNIMRKLEVKNVVELIKRIMEMKLIT